ncbi:hypothetical protein [Streptomyces sp. G45]|uniref:hypothetical protein n=1 Tax=Streptomyces sp. G45 TaxID=3406627 RepID=UPI003C2048BD
MLSTDEVRDLLAPRVVGKWDEGAGLVLEVVGIEVVLTGRKLTVYLEVVAPDGRWRLRSDRDNSDVNVFNGRPPEELLHWIAWSLRVELFEWWHTKRSERRSAKLGERLDAGPDAGPGKGSGPAPAGGS